MHSRSFRTIAGWLGFILVFVGLIEGLPQGAVGAQNDIAQIIVLDTQTAHFPNLDIWTRFLTTHGLPVSYVNAADLELLEDGQPLSFNIEAVQGPVQLMLVLDAGAGIRAKYENTTRLAVMKQIGNAILQSLTPEDTIGIIEVTPSGASVLQALTQDKEKARNQLEAWAPAATRDLSKGLEGVRLAIEEMRRVDSPYPRLVIFLTAAVQTGNNEEPVITSLARQHRVTVYAFNLHFKGSVVGYQQLTADTQGAIFKSNQMADFLQALNAWRAQFHIKARSHSAAQQRDLKLQVKGRAETAVIWPVKLSSPVAPPLVSIVVNDGQEHLIIQHEGDAISPNVIPVTVQIQWQDPYPRQIERVELYVQGQLYETPRQNVDASQPVVYQWHVQPEYESVKFVARVYDELGLQAEAEKTITQEIARIGQQDILCRSLPKIPTIGAPLHSFFCATLGMGLSELLLLIAIIGLSVVGVRKREYIKEAAVQVTQAIAQVTRTFGRRKAKARLVVTEGRGEDQSLPEVIELYGETSIGRDPKFADIVLNRPAVSRLHCALHEDLNTGQWSIEDKESTNGTFVNGQRLEPHQRHPLRNGDQIEIAPLYRGGIRFRFEILESEPASDLTDDSVLLSETWMDDQIEEVAQTVEVTQDLVDDVLGDAPAWDMNTPDQRGVASGSISSNHDDEEEFDPSQYEF